ncbi:MAG: C10 family peptidase [Bacteroidales bacterium]|nr:C10 family peptidase [Bacteroidales bacterium]
MIKKVFIFNILVLVLLSCGKQPLDRLDNQFPGVDVTTLPAFEYKVINHLRSTGDITAVAERVFPEKELTDLCTVGEKGQASLYVANFKEGWAIMAADDRANQEILAYGESGSFDPDNITNPGIAAWFEITKEQQAKIAGELDIIKIEKPGQDEIEEYVPYYWLGFPVGVEYSNNFAEVNHLLSTKWSQAYPWSQKCVYYGDGGPVGYFHTGCLAVSTAQVMYYLRMNKGFTIGLYDSVYPTFSDMGDNVYCISSLQRTGFNVNSPKWAQMPLTAAGSHTDYVSDLMIDIGYQYGLTYSLAGTGTFYQASVFPDYNVLCSEGAFYYSLAKESLDDGFPVMVVAYQTPSYLRSHAWVIDGYKQAQSVTDRQYRWYMAPSDSLSYYSGYEFCYTEAQKQQYAPDANEEEIYHIYEVMGGNFLRMNWGWDDDSDDGYYSMIDYNWPTGSNNSYKYHPWICYGFYQEDEEDIH